ncbi:hypothetical protein [Tsuneonella amylolytica]|uniref:hypothetical protein n=1 Tax=Tsuneonella amylolytica TaxID=2338327 RepID=UPI000EA8FF83|nr:hypothetical protein [Tsuneonella amylolytica]
MRIVQRLNPGPGIADFWSEFKRPNRYRWPILAGSALLTGSLMYMLTDHAAGLNWLVGGIIAIIGAIALAAMAAEHVKIKVWALLLAAVVPSLIFWQFAGEKWRVPIPPNKVDFITTFEPGRTDAEIEASNLANQKVQDRLAAEQRQREEDVRQMYRDLGRATGLDVDAMERRLAEEEAADAAGAPASNTQGSQPAR